MVVADDPRILELTAPEGDLVARFATHVGMVGCSLRHRGEELLGLRGGLGEYVREGHVFGVPLLYPWANRLAGWSYDVAGRHVELDRDSELLHGDEHCLPIHGALAARSDWSARTVGPSVLEAELDFGAHADLVAVFPFPHRLALRIGLGGGRMTVTTTITAGEGAPVPLSFGFHPYLAPPGAARGDWLVELPARTALALDEQGLPTGAQQECSARTFRLGDETYDDLFAVADPARFSVTAGCRRLWVELASGFPYAQVFAPPDQPVICFEPMTAPVNALRTHDGLRMVPAGGTAQTMFVLGVDALSSGSDEPAAHDAA